ncbi:MAG: phosphotransferase [Polymorphobacter sp.]
MTSATALIPADLAASIVRQTGAAIVDIVPRGGGGASRQGAELTLLGRDGATSRCYLAYDSRAGDPQRVPFFNREVAILDALGSSFAECGVKAPRLVASEAAHLALLTELTPGRDRFADAADPIALAADFMAQLAALHRIPPGSHVLASLGDPAVAISDVIEARIAELQAANMATLPDPLLQLALQWLAGNVPVDRGPPVIVHGDAGPGNFLHQDNRVTALLDWEFVHFGDPMEDLAQIWVRSMIQPFVPMRQVFAAYEAAGGVAVDLDRVRFHRLYFQLGFVVGGHANLFGDSNVKTAMVGASMMYNALHMRAIALSLAELSGQALHPAVLPEANASLADRGYELVLDDLRDSVVPRLADQHAAAKAKSIARMVKYWRARDRYAAAFEAAEIAEIADALAIARPASVLEARCALAGAISQRRLDFDRALQLCLNRVARDTALMADAMGGLATAYFPPLDENAA